MTFWLLHWIFWFLSQPKYHLLENPEVSDLPFGNSYADELFIAQQFYGWHCYAQYYPSKLQKLLQKIKF